MKNRVYLEEDLQIPKILEATETPVKSNVLITDSDNSSFQMKKTEKSSTL